MAQTVCPLVSAEDRARLEAIVADRNRAQKHVARARIVLASAERLPVAAIAKRAGVGQGTLYRHFPTREALLAEVYRRDVDDLVAAAPALLTAHDPMTALARWFDRVVDHAEVKRGVLAAVEAGVWRQLAERSHGPIGDALTLLLDAGKAGGTVRAEVDARDVVLLMGCLTRLDRDEWDARARPLMGVILDGLRRPAGPPG